jgi:predicted RNA binding protein YcfA (HicA-like mRNA interferase family)
MKRRDLLRHLSQHGCSLLREGGSHSIWTNPKEGLHTAIPRHREIAEFTALRICEQLKVPSPNV